MKVFRCGDVVPGCSRTFEGATEDEVLAQVREHAREGHDVQLDDRALAAVRAAVRDA